MRKYFYEIILFIATVIYGFSYPFHTTSAYYLGPLTVNFLRYIIGAVFLLPYVLKIKEKPSKAIWAGSLFYALSVFVTHFLQQLVAPYTSNGKMGFISSLFIVIVPLLYFLIYKTKIKKLTLISVFIAFIGLALLCEMDGFIIASTDLALVIAAVSLAFEIIIIDVYSKKDNPILLMFFAYIFSASLNGILIPFFEDITISNLQLAAPSVLYLGVGCTGIVYTLQAISQKRVNTIVASVILSLESVISVFAGYFIMNQILTLKEMIGCVIVFIGVLLCEFSTIDIKKNEPIQPHSTVSN